MILDPGEDVLKNLLKKNSFEQSNKSQPINMSNDEAKKIDKALSNKKFRLVIHDCYSLLIKYIDFKSTISLTKK